MCAYWKRPVSDSGRVPPPCWSPGTRAGLCGSWAPRKRRQAVDAVSARRRWRHTHPGHWSRCTPDRMPRWVTPGRRPTEAHVWGAANIAREAAGTSPGDEQAVTIVRDDFGRPTGVRWRSPAPAAILFDGRPVRTARGDRGVDEDVQLRQLTPDIVAEAPGLRGRPPEVVAQRVEDRHTHPRRTSPSRRDGRAGPGRRGPRRRPEGRRPGLPRARRPTMPTTSGCGPESSRQRSAGARRHR